MADIPAIAVGHVSKTFRLPHERYAGIKQAVINFRFGKTYEAQKVLKDISFEIKKGEFFGIVGRNGSGKSTLLKLLAMVYTPNEGQIQINGSLTPFIELGVGFNPELTGRENIYLNGALLGFDRDQIAAMYHDIVHFAELEPFMDQKLKNYSSGMQVRLAFSIAIRAKSDILLIDEVLAVGDAAFQKKCFDYFYELKNTNTTVCFVSHDMAMVERFCDRALYLEGGEIVSIDKPGVIAELYREKNMERELLEETQSSETPQLVRNKDVEMITQTCDTKGKKTRIFTAAQDINLQVTIKAVKDITDGVFTFTLEGGDANTILLVESDTLGVPLINLAKGEEKTLTFEIQNIFSEGNYTFDIEFSTPHRQYIYGHLDRAAVIKVADYGLHPWLLKPKVSVKSEGR